MITLVDQSYPRASSGLAVRVIRSVRADVANVRSTFTARALLIGSAVMACVSCVANLATVADADLASPDTVQLAMHSSTVATLVFAMVAGVVSATADFRFGRVDQLLLSDPNRSVLLGAKALVATLVGFIYGIVGSIAAVAATAGFFAMKGEAFDIMSEAVFRPLVGLLLGASLLGACGIAIGFAVRHQPAALAGSLAWLLIVEPTALVGLPGAGRWLPGAASLALTVSPDPNLLGQTSGALLLLAWTAVATAAAFAAFRRTDL